MKIKTLDDAVVNVDRINSMLFLYETCLEDILVSLENGGTDDVPLFLKSYDHLRYQLYAVQDEVRNLHEAMKGFLK